jgi:hypothetical protein
MKRRISSSMEGGFGCREFHSPLAMAMCRLYGCSHVFFVVMQVLVPFWQLQGWGYNFPTKPYEYTMVNLGRVVYSEIVIWQALVFCVCSLQILDDVVMICRLDSIVILKDCFFFFFYVFACLQLELELCVVNIQGLYI